MKIIAVIPARYESSRLPGKPLADICGRPMIWWVYQRTIRAHGLSDVIVAIDDKRVAEACDRYGIKWMMTSKDHKRHVDRIHEISDQVSADFYAVVCGDEPMIEPRAIEQVLPDAEDLKQEYVIRSLMRVITDPVELMDSATIKAVVGENDTCLLLTRSAAPYPYKTVNFTYKRLVGIECYNKKALDFFSERPVSLLEGIEDVTLLRYLEHGIPISLIMTDTYQMGVDTAKNLEVAREAIIKAGGLLSLERV